MNKNWFYIDIHSHILPGIDDGAADMTEALAMAEAAYSEGIRAIIATPHYGVMNPDFDRSKAEQVFRETYSEIKKRWPDMLMVLGNEVFYSSSCIEALQTGKAMTLSNTNYVLVEFYPDVSFREIEIGMRNLLNAGYIPVLAHIERYMCLEKELDLVDELIEMGVYIQVNGRSFLRKRFDRRGSWCRTLLKNGMIHFVATDSHNDGSRRPVMEAVVEKMCSIADEDEVYDIVFRNGIKLLKNQLI